MSVIQIEALRKEEGWIFVKILGQSIKVAISYVIQIGLSING